MKQTIPTRFGYMEDDHIYTRAFSMWRMADRRFWHVCPLTEFGAHGFAVVDDFGDLAKVAA